jgi:hypothetical protein
MRPGRRGVDRVNRNVFATTLASKRPAQDVRDRPKQGITSRLEEVRADRLIVANDREEPGLLPPGPSPKPGAFSSRCFFASRSPRNGRMRDVQHRLRKTVAVPHPAARISGGIPLDADLNCGLRPFGTPEQCVEGGRQTDTIGLEPRSGEARERVPSRTHETERRPAGRRSGWYKTRAYTVTVSATSTKSLIWSKFM